jgi:hypothetical protein
MGLTTDPTDPRLGHGSNEKEVPQNEAYLILSDEERAKGLVRPIRLSYIHVGAAGPTYPLRDLTEEEVNSYGDRYAKFEEYPEEEPGLGRFWKQSELDNIGKGCGAVTSMNHAIAETYARNPSFYGATYCVNCMKHLPVGKLGEFVWDGTDERVGT